jgi:hypothetical protein
MSDFDKNSKLVKCPFFKGQDIAKLYCEGLMPNSSIILSFSGKSEKETYRIHYCQQHYRYCKVYYLNDTKYDEEGNLK